MIGSFYPFVEGITTQNSTDDTGETKVLKWRQLGMLWLSKFYQIETMTILPLLFPVWYQKTPCHDWWTIFNFDFLYFFFNFHSVKRLPGYRVWRSLESRVCLKFVGKNSIPCWEGLNLCDLPSCNCNQGVVLGSPFGFFKLCSFVAILFIEFRLTLKDFRNN